MPALFLKPSLHLAAVRDDLIILDVEAGEYGCLTGLGSLAAHLASDGRLDLAQADVADWLLEAGVATHEAYPSERELPPPATDSCWRSQRPPVRSGDRRRFAAAFLSAAPRVWRAPFRRLVATARRGRVIPQSAGVAPALVRDAQVFDQLAPFAPFQGECLFRAFMLLAYLRLAGRDATWVFGVRTYPFGAHCWLQAGDMLLNDALERVCAYTPILAI